MQSRCLLIPALVCVLAAPDLGALQATPRACDQFLSSVRADSANLDAAARLGECSVRDYEMIAPGGDSTRMVFRSNWSSALRALRRAVEVDPRYTRAYRPLFAILFAETRDGCSSVTGECRYVSPVVRDGDSVITIPRLVRLNVSGADTYAEVIRESQANRRASLAEARSVAKKWVSVAPDDRRPGIAELLAAGDTVGARHMLASMDSIIAPQGGTMRAPPIGREHLESAKFHLALGDTVGAEAQLAGIERILQYRPFQYSPGLVFSDPRPWMGLAWSLAAEVAAARGRPDEAARLYRRVIGLWGGGDSDLDAVVEHARTRLRLLAPR